MDGQNKNRGAAHVQSVGRALEIVDLLAQKKSDMSLTEISCELGWPKSTVYGLLSTLRDYQYIDQDAESGRYRLGVHLFELGNLVARGWDIRAVALQPMQRLNRQLGEMVQLATENNGEVLYLEKVDSSHLIRIVSEIGARLPIHCSALGKVMLAYRSPADWKRILRQRGMPSMTTRTITSLVQMEAELAKIRHHGYAIDDGEIMDSLRCVAAPIHTPDGMVRYAISVSGLSSAMQGEHFDNIVQALLKASGEISYAMGYRAKA